MNTVLRAGGGRELERRRAHARRHGLIVFNDRNYPRFNRLLAELDVPWRWSDMSFGFHTEDNACQYAGTGINGLFAQRRNLLSRGHWAFLRGIVRFGQRSRVALEAGGLAGLSLGAYLREIDCPQRVVDDYVLPMGAAIWSSSKDDMRAFPAELFLRFFDNHGLLALNDRPRWKTIVGGSRSYVRILRERLVGTVFRNAAVRAVRRRETGVDVITGDGTRRPFDGVVVATHADEALQLLSDPSGRERRLLGAWRYSDNAAVLHSDRGIMPRSRRAWAAWNYCRAAGEPARPVAVTYHMTRRQGLPGDRDYFVTLNPTRRLELDQVHHATRFTHPIYELDSVATQSELPSLNGDARTWFCGAYFGHGFHEDAIRSGVDVARQMGVQP